MRSETAGRNLNMKYSLDTYIEMFRQDGLSVTVFPAGADTTVLVEHVTADSREAVPGTLFVCKGANFKDQYALSARDAGAVACVGEKLIDGAGTFIVVDDVRRAMILTAMRFYEHAPDSLSIAGITGTKGKSTTTHFLYSIVNSWLTDTGRPECALMSTIETYDGIDRFESHLTTPEPLDVYRHCSNAVGCGMTHMVMEISSQALKYGRVDGITFDVGCFLNIGEDHISPVEHADFDDYLNSKLRIFDVSRCVCVNSDSDHLDRILGYGTGRCRIVRFGTHPEDDIYCSSSEKRDGAIFFKVRTPEYETEMCLNMPGLYNVSNALGAVAMSCVLGIPEKYVVSGLASAKVPGRNDVFSSKDGKVVALVNYAHNKLSYEATLQSARVEYPGMKIISIFGAAGGRAEIRRRDLPMTAEKYSDLILVTEDDPGPEPLSKISSEIAANISKCPYEIIDDRGEAIKRAVLDDSMGPRVLLAMGKGDSSYMARGSGFVDYPSDVDFIKKYIAEYDASRSE